MIESSQYLYAIENLVFNYELEAFKIEALRHLNLSIPKGVLVTLSGPSGSGKSTLLNILGLIEPVQAGSVLLNGQALQTMSEEDKNVLRKFYIGFIFQRFHLIAVLNVWENVGYFLSRQGLSRSEIQTRIEEALVAVNLWQERFKKPSELSGGQKQRVAIARALAKHPKVIIGDEPTASLDQRAGQEIMEILAKMVTGQNKTVIIATHDPMVQSFASKNFHIQDGHLV